MANKSKVNVLYQAAKAVVDSPKGSTEGAVLFHREASAETIILIIERKRFAEQKAARLSRELDYITEQYRVLAKREKILADALSSCDAALQREKEKSKTQK